MDTINDFIKHSLVCFITSFGFLISFEMIVNNIFTYSILLESVIYLLMWNCIFFIPSFLITRLYSLSIITIVLCLGYVFFLLYKQYYYESLSIDMHPEYYKRGNVSRILWYILTFVNQIMTKFYILGFKRIRQKLKKR